MMDKKDSRKFFEDWLKAYSDHLHLVRHGHRVDLVTPAAAKPPVSVKRPGDVSVSSQK